MPRRSIARPVGKTDIIDMKTGKPASSSPLPLLCERIRFFRERAGMEQKILAGKIGVTANAVSNWENGRGRPDINLLPDICRALEIRMEELFGLEVSAGNAGPEEMAFLDRCRLLTPGHRLAVDRMVDTLLKIQDAETCPSLRRLVSYRRSLSAGFGDPTEFDSEGDPIFLYPSREVDRSDCVFTVNGDSMEPRFQDGDMVLVARIPDAPALRQGEGLSVSSACWRVPALTGGYFAASFFHVAIASRTCSTVVTTRAVPPAAFIRRMVSSCSGVGFPPGRFTSNPKKCPSITPQISGIPRFA